MANLLDALRDEVKTMVGEEVRRVMGEMISGDRRTAPRTKDGRSKRTCPVPGCKNVFAPRYYGFCADHRKTAGFRKKKAEAEKAKKTSP